ncbi:MAG: hypothetical protein IPK03_10330 [Bacteroidetes bacterium]|nr:hypothetical protein [Bacteroidota bacterium]
MGITWTAPDGFNNCSSLNTPTSYRNTYDIYTSVNGGPYTLIATEYHTQGVTGYGYTYTIPDIAPASIKVKIIAKYNPACFPTTPIFWQDSSDFSSTLNAPSGSITVLTPNGGVNLNANTNYNVTWTASGTSGFYDIQYSTNGGLSYATIASNVSGTSYNWAIPNMVNNANVFVRVRDFTNNCRKDASNAANTINSAKPVLNSPNGGEIWKVGNNHSISWNTSTILGNAILEFSTDNGLNWNNIATVSNSGNYSWAIPNLTTNQALVRISGSALTSFLDTSNAAFTITLPTPVLTSPDGGESWQYNSTYDITWDASSITSNVKLEFSIDSGTTWSVITNSTSNTGTYSWLIPATYRVLQNRALVRITNVTYPTAIDTSPNFFTIRPAVHVTSPNAATTYTSCNNLNITWTVGSGFNNYLSQNTPTSYRGRFEIYTSINGGSWSNIWTEYHNQGQTNYSFNYAIPDAAPASLKVMVIGYYNPTQYGSNVLYWADSSDFSSNIINPTGTITVLSPNGSVNLTALTNYNITWSATGSSGFYDIGYSTSATSGFQHCVQM